MTEPVVSRTFIVKGTNNKQVTINAEKPGYIDAVLGKFIGNTITQEELKKLQKAANGSGKNSTVIEACELPTKELRTAAKHKYYDMYDIIESQKYKDYYAARVRENDVSGQTVRNDFGLPEGHLFENNRESFLDRRPLLHSGPWANHADFEEGEILYFHKDDTKFKEEGPAGNWTRFWK